MQSFHFLGKIRFDESSSCPCLVKWDPVDGGLIEFESEFMSENAKFKNLAVETPNNYYTVLDRGAITFGLGGSYTVASIKFDRIIRGVGYTEYNDISSKKYDFDLEFPSKWIHPKLLPIAFGDFQPQTKEETDEYVFDDGQLTISRKIQEIKWLGEHKTTEYTSFSLSYTSETHIDKLLVDLDKIAEFISFFSGAKPTWSNIQWTYICEDASNSFECNLSQKTPVRKDVKDQLFSYELIQPDFQTAFRSWMNMDSSSRDLFKLISGIKTQDGTRLVAFFLAIIQFIEGFHRLKHPAKLVDKAIFRNLCRDVRAIIKATTIQNETQEILLSRLGSTNELSLKSRLQSVKERTSALVNLTDEDIDLAVSVRNYYTHYDAKSLKSPIDWLQVRSVSGKLWKAAYHMAMESMGIRYQIIKIAMNLMDRL